MRFSKTEVKQMRADLQEALNTVAKKYDAEAQIGSISFGASAGMRLTISKMSSNKNGDFAMTPEAQEFLQRAQGLGFKKEILGEELIYQGKKIVITGYKKRSRKYPICYTQNGQPYKAGEDYIKKVVGDVYPEWLL